MLKLVVGEEEWFDNTTQEFITTEGVEVELEHSLLSLSKWESRFETPFLADKEKTTEEELAYVRCMILDPILAEDPNLKFTNENLITISEYISAANTATTFGELPKRKMRNEVITAELIYYWMVSFTIPFSCEEWHLNRLFALIQICNIKNSKPVKKSRAEQAAENKRINDARRAQLNSTG